MVKKIGTTLPEAWFLERVGENIMAESSDYNGVMKITDTNHAEYLCYVSQKYFYYRFSEYDRVRGAEKIT